MHAGIHKPLSCCSAVPVQLPSYRSSAGGNYTLHIEALSQAAAEASCRTQGGHLAHFASQAEQVGPGPQLAAAAAVSVQPAAALVAVAAGIQHPA